MKTRYTLPLAAALLAAHTGAAQTSARSSVQSMNPDISVIIDTFYYKSDTEEDIEHIKEDLRGFGYVCDGDHHHGDTDEGFNLRHLELQFMGMVDPYFKATAIAGIDIDGAEIEVAEIETLGLPGGFKIKAGKFFSDFGYLNAKHTHEWDFTDQPMILNLLLGEHGLNDKGAQLSWLAPLPFFVMTGMEAFQGENERMFDYHGDGPLPEHDGPRVFTAWVKTSPGLPGAHGLQLGASAGTGKHQEEHDGNGDGDHDHWFDGRNSFIAADFIYKYNAPRPYGQGDFTLQGEYMYRKSDLDMVENLYAPELEGNSLLKKQDGYYVQALYGFLPRWRCGVRWEQIGLTNKQTEPSGAFDSFGSSYRIAGMLDFTPTEFSRLRMQVNSGRYDTDDGKENAVEGFLQLMISLGTHGAHKF